MKRVTIPDTDLTVSNICYGAAYCAFEDEARYFECLDNFIYLGGNFIDTANIYGKWLDHGKNSNEIMLGNWMRQRSNRGDIVLASKAAHPDLATMNVPRISYEEITCDLEESLTALQTDYLDILWLHRDAENIPAEEIEPFLNSAPPKSEHTMRDKPLFLAFAHPWASGSTRHVGIPWSSNPLDT